MNKLLFSALVLLPSLSFAQITDLVLPEEVWYGGFTGYVCEAGGAEVAQPTELAELGVTFTEMRTDNSLSNAIIDATFQQGESVCRYQAVLFAEKIKDTAELIQSLAYDPAGGALAYRNCAAGKKLLDQALAFNDYLKYDKPYKIAIMAPFANAEAVCGEGAEFVGIRFTAIGRIQK